MFSRRAGIRRIKTQYMLNHIKNKSLINIIYDIYQELPAISQDKINKYEKIKHYLIPVKYRKRAMPINLLLCKIVLILIYIILYIIMIISNIFYTIKLVIKKDIGYNSYFDTLKRYILEDKTKYFNPLINNINDKVNNNFKRTKEFLNNIDTEEDKDNLYRLFTFIYLKPFNLHPDTIDYTFLARRTLYYSFLVYMAYFYVIPYIYQMYKIYI